MNRFTYLFLVGLLVLSFWELTNSQAHEHKEDDHDADDEFKREFGDEVPSFKYRSNFISPFWQHQWTSFSQEPTHSMGSEDEHFEVREQSEFVKPQGIPAKDLPPIRFVFWLVGYQVFMQSEKLAHSSPKIY